MLLIPIRYPSGADLATCAKPNSPEAPGLLLTTTGTPSRLDRCSASVRAVVSVPPPAANPTTSSIGFFGPPGPPGGRGEANPRTSSIGLSGQAAQALPVAQAPNAHAPSAQAALRRVPAERGQAQSDAKSDICRSFPWVRRLRAARAHGPGPGTVGQPQPAQSLAITA